MVGTLINDKNDVKMFKTKGTTPAAGEWFHSESSPSTSEQIVFRAALINQTGF